MNDFETMQDIHNRYIAAQTEANERNKTRTFDALSSAGITKVEVTFDGIGDSGQIESVTAFTGETEATFPLTSVYIDRVTWGSSVSSMTENAPLEEAIEILCYGYLAQMYGGWENNEGAFGEFTFDVPARSIAFEFNGRHIDHSTSTHTL